MYTFRHARASDIVRCHQIESAAYPADEAASLEKISIRITRYPQGFLVMEHQGEIIGFINSGCAQTVTMSDTAFKELVGHDPDAPNVVIMSVVLDPAHQGKGYTRPLMNAFVDNARQLGKRSIHLMCKDRLVPMYTRQGYTYVCPSASAYAGESWHDMVMDLTTAAPVVDLCAAHARSLLALNNAHLIELSVLDEASLQSLLDGAFYARGIGNLAAALIALDQSHPRYASPNYLWFRARYPRFVYIDRVVVDPVARGQGHARRLYADLLQQAAAAGHGLVVCEVNANPPNPASDAFHASLGFTEIGSATIHGGAKTVRYLARHV
jgi:predicted GNAT superfamily acetyltransferase